MRRPDRAILAIVPLVALIGCDRVVETLPSLKNQTGFFRATLNAPESRFVPAGIDGGAATGGPQSGLSAVDADGGAFRQAEVAPDRWAETQALLTGLKAQQSADGAIRFSLPADVLFDFDKATLRADADAPLAQATRLIAAYPKAPVTIVGHTDAKGEDAYNERLSLARARTVAARLTTPDAPPPVVEGRGERDPVAPNAHADGSDDPDGRQRNRRVEIILARPVAAAAQGE